MAQVDIDRGQEFHKCIECFLCQNVCHVIRDHEENKPRYAGPRFFVRLAELEMHPLDTLDRRDYIREDMGIGFCNITKCCTEVCPEDIHITDNAIIPSKERVVDARYDPIAWLGRKITGRPAPLAAAEGSSTPVPPTRKGPRRRRRRRVIPPMALTSPATVAEFLSDGWFDALAAALSGLRPATSALGRTRPRARPRADSHRSPRRRRGERAQKRRSPLHDRARTRFPGVARAGLGRVGRSDDRQDWSTAQAIASGSSSVSDMLSAGKIKLRGDTGALVAAGDLLAMVAPLIAGALA